MTTSTELVAPVVAGVDADAAVRLAQELVRLPSVVGEEGDLAEALRARMAAMGFLAYGSSNDARSHIDCVLLEGRLELDGVSLDPRR